MSDERFYVAREFQQTTIPKLICYAVIDRVSGSIATPIEESLFGVRKGLVGEDAEDPVARDLAEAHAIRLNQRRVLK